MTRLAAVMLTGIVAVAASLFCAGPALADVAPQPAVAGVVVLTLIILGVIVIVVAVVSVFVLRGIARSRRKAEMRDEQSTERQTAGGGGAPPDAPDAGEDER